MVQTRFVAGKDFGTVCLDGVEVRDVIECDTEYGFVIAYERDGNGRLVIDGDSIRSRMLIGKVTFAPMVAP